jgi:hypothetical protein
MVEESSSISDIIVTLVTDGERLAMTLGAARVWAGSPGYALAPLAFPYTFATSEAGSDAALILGARLLGCDILPVTSAWTYGPSARHAMDRAPAANEDAPFLSYERFDAPEAGPNEPQGPRRVRVRVYLARAVGAGVDVLWAPLGALRAALGGVWLGALLAMEGVTLRVSSEAPAADTQNTLVYMPAGAGERQVLRACAKYGDQILFPPLVPDR